MDSIIAKIDLMVERKHLAIQYCENPRGRFLRIAEEAQGRRNTVIVPSTGVSEFLESIASVLVLAGEPLPAAPIL